MRRKRILITNEDRLYNGEDGAKEGISCLGPTCSIIEIEALNFRIDNVKWFSVRLLLPFVVEDSCSNILDLHHSRDTVIHLAIKLNTDFIDEIEFFILIDAGHLLENVGIDFQGRT